PTARRYGHVPNAQQLLRCGFSPGRMKSSDCRPNSRDCATRGLPRARLRSASCSTALVGRLTREMYWQVPCTCSLRRLSECQVPGQLERNGGSSMRMFRMLSATVLMVSVVLVTEAIGQVQNPPPARETPPPASTEPPIAGEEKRVEGQVRSINSSGTEII